MTSALARNQRLRSLLAVLVTLLALAAFSSADAAAERRVALVLGNSDYTSVAALPNPVNDASDIADVLRKLKFEVTLALNLSREGFERKLAEFKQLSANADVAVVFYAGHGISVNNENFLIPIDVPAEIEVAENEADGMKELSKFLVGLEPIADAVSDSKLSILLLDSCRNKSSTSELGLKLVAKGSGSATRALRFSRGTGNISVPSTSGRRGILRAYATAPNAVADDGIGRNSPFTRALLKYLPQRNLELRDLLMKVRDSVWEETNGKQNPWEEGAPLKKFYFASLSTDSGSSPEELTKPGVLDRPRSQGDGSKANRSSDQKGGTAARRRAAAPRAASSRPANRMPPGIGMGVGAGL